MANSKQAERNLVDLIERTDAIIASTKERSEEYACDVAQRILEGRVNALDKTRMLQHSLEEDAATIRNLEFQRGAYQTALLIVKVTSGAYVFAARTSYYGDLELAAFDTEEERHAFIEEHDYWRRANEDDLDKGARGYAVLRA